MLTARQNGNRIEITVQFEAKTMDEIIEMAATLLSGMTDVDRLRVLVREAEIRAERARKREGGGANA